MIWNNNIEQNIAVDKKKNNEYESNFIKNKNQ